MPIKTLLSVLLTFFITLGSTQAEQIASYQGLTASVPDGTTCGPSARVTVNAPDASAYSGDRVPLQNLIGGIRANFADCPNLKSLDLTGLENGRPVFRATITAQNGWKLPTGLGRILAENPTPGQEVKSAHCDYEPNDPLIGCWVSLQPTKFAGSITNIRRDHSWYFGTADKLASGTMTAYGPDIQRAYMVGTGLMADVLDWDGKRHQVPGAGPYMAFKPHAGGFSPVQGPYFGLNCSLLLLAPYAPLGLNMSGTNDNQVLARLRPLTIAADILTGRRHPQHIEDSIPGDAVFYNCPENYTEATLDHFLSQALLFATPLFAQVIKADAKQLLFPVVVRQAEEVGILRTLAVGEATSAEIGAGEIEGRAAAQGEEEAATFSRNGTAATGAGSSLNGFRLRNQLISHQIAWGHAFDKHVLGIANPGGAEFSGLGIRTLGQFSKHIETVINNPTESRLLARGREYFYSKTTNTIVIFNPKAIDGGTAFRPENWSAFRKTLN